MKEKWKIVKGWPGYYISNLGRLKKEAYVTKQNKLSPERIISSHNSGRHVHLWHKGLHKLVSVAYLVLVTFIGPPPTKYGRKKGNSLARHLDDNESNNKLTNLAWGTQIDNMADARRNGNPSGMTGRKHSQSTKRKLSKAMRGKPWTQARHQAQLDRRL